MMRSSDIRATVQAANRFTPNGGVMRERLLGLVRLAHQAGLYDLDLHPGNVLVAGDRTLGPAADVVALDRGRAPVPDAEDAGAQVGPGAPGVQGQGAGYAYALALAAGEGVRVAGHVFGPQTHAAQELRHPVLELLP